MTFYCLVVSFIINKQTNKPGSYDNEWAKLKLIALSSKHCGDKVLPNALQKYKHTHTQMSIFQRIQPPGTVVNHCCGSEWCWWRTAITFSARMTFNVKKVGPVHLTQKTKFMYPPPTCMIAARTYNNRCIQRRPHNAFLLPTVYLFVSVSVSVTCDHVVVLTIITMLHKISERTTFTIVI